MAYSSRYSSRGRGFGGRGFGGRGRGRGRGGVSFRDRSKRAPLEDCNNSLITDIERHENNTDATDQNWINNVITRQDQKSNDTKPKEIFMNNNTKHKEINVETNTYPIHFDNKLIVSEWELLDITNPTNTNNKIKKLQNKQIFMKLYKNKSNIHTLNKLFIKSYSDSNSLTIITLHFNDTNNNNNKNSDIEIIIDNIKYIMSKKTSFTPSELQDYPTFDDTKQRIYFKLIDYFFTNNKYNKKEGAYFERNVHSQAMGNVSYMEGFKASIVHIVREPRLGIKIWNRFLYLESETVRDHLKYNKPEALLINKKAMVMYSMGIIHIDKIDREHDERDGFKTQDGKQITYKDYISDRYNIDKYDIKDEKYGLIIDKKGNTYLPQYLRVMIDSKSERAKQTGKQLNKMNTQRLKMRGELVRKLSKINNKKQHIFSIDIKPVNTKGFVLQDPRIEMNINGKNECMNMSEGMKSWRMLSGTVDSKMGGNKEYKKWYLYVYDHTNSGGSGGYNNNKFNKLAGNITSYINKRRFGDYFHSNIESIRHLDDELFSRNCKINKTRSIVFCIIEANVFGSKEKRDYHAKFLEHEIKSQFIEEKNIYNNIKVYGCMDDVMFKINESLYSIKSSQTHHDNLLLGFDVNHCTNKQRPSVGVFTGIRKYYIPKQNRIHGCAVLLPPKTEQPSTKVTKEMTKNVLLTQLKKMIKLPEVIWYFRDGISVSQFAKFSSTEMVGIKDGIEDIKSEEKLKKLFGENELKSWQPKLEIVVIQKRINDKFISGSALHKDANTYIVPFDVVSNVMLDLYIKKGDNHPLRVIFIVDDLEFSRNGKIMQACQFILDLLYCFPYGMPLGACAIPSPIKWADKWAQTYQELINSEKHKSIEDVSAFLNLAYVKLDDDSKERDKGMDVEYETTDNKIRCGGDTIEKRDRRRDRDRNRNRNINDDSKEDRDRDREKYYERDRDRHSEKDRYYKKHKYRKRSRSRSRSRSRHRDKRYGNRSTSRDEDRGRWGA